MGNLSNYLAGYGITTVEQPDAGRKVVAESQTNGNLHGASGGVVAAEHSDADRPRPGR